MKVSAEQKLQTREKIVDAAADLFVEQGFDKVSMKRIAREAGIGDATIYKYFPNKDKLIIGFYESRAQRAIDQHLEACWEECYNFPEKLQLLIDCYLGELVKDREFVDLSLRLLMKSPLTMLQGDIRPARLFKDRIRQLIDELEQDPEYPELPIPELFSQLLVDALMGLVVFWTRDESEGFSDTDRLADMSVQVADAFIKSGLLPRMIEMASFFLKSYLLRGMAEGNLLKTLSTITKDLRHE